MKPLFILELSLMWQTFNFVISFEVFLNSNCSVDLTIFWKDLTTSVAIFACVPTILRR